MPLSIESITTAALSAALDAATHRHAAVAANIANARTEGYTPQRLSFDARLDEAKAALHEGGWLDAEMVEGLRGAVQSSGDAGQPSAKLHLDMQMTELARNSVHFQTLTQAVSRHLGLLALAAGDGRR